jgi:hypothetical protein
MSGAGREIAGRRRVRTLRGAQPSPASSASMARPATRPHKNNRSPAMQNLLKRFQSYWLADASFLTLLVMLIAVVFVLPIVMETSGRGVLMFNVLLLSVFFSGIFSTPSVPLMSLSAVLFCIHLGLRLIRFGDNPFSFFIL